MAGAVEDYSGFMVRGYVNVWFPGKLRPILVHAARELGFGSIAELCRTATREYLERRGLLKTESGTRMEKEARPPEALAPTPSGGPSGGASRDE